MRRTGAFVAQARDVVTFQRMTAVSDDYGNTTGDWSDLAKRKAYLRERLGREAVEQGAVQDVAATIMRVRADSVTRGITVADRVIARGTIWAIKSVMQVNSKGDKLEMRIEKGVAS